MAVAATGVGILLSDDLIFTSRVTGTARALGLTVHAAVSAAALIDLAAAKQPTAALIDLALVRNSIGELAANLRAGCPPLKRMVAYGSHVDTAGLKAAREAGCSPVLPRSQFVTELPLRLAEWLA